MRSNFVLLVLAGIIFSIFSSIYNYRGSANLDVYDLSGVWDICLGKDEKRCGWEKGKIPIKRDGQIFLNSNEFKGWMTIKKNIEIPQFCHSSRCSIVISEIGDAAEIFLNGRLLQTHGGVPPSYRYKKHLPAIVQLPIEDFSSRSSAQLVIKSYSPKNSQVGVRGSFFAVTKSENAESFERLIVGKNVVTPIVVAFMIFSIFTTCLWVNIAGIFSQPVKYSFIFHFAASTLFLISFSELPREFMSLGTSGGIHFLLRLLFDYSFFESVIALYQIKTNISKLRYVYIIQIVAFALTHFYFDGALFDISYLLMRFSFPLLLVPHILLAFSVSTNSLVPVCRGFKTLVYVTLIMLISDILVFHNFASSGYYVKFYPLFISIFFLVMTIKEKVNDLTQIQISKEKIIIAEQVSHDLRSPIAALETIFKNEVSLNGDSFNLLNSCLDRLKTISKRGLKEIGRSSTSVDIVPLLNTIVERKKLEYRNNTGVNIHFHSEFLSKYLVIDEDEFASTLSNLINNSVEARRDDNEINIYVNLNEENGLKLSVLDDGIGINSDILSQLGSNKISTKLKKGGNGIALVNIKRFLDKYGYKFDINSMPSMGTEIVIEF